MLEAAQHARTFAAGRSRADLDVVWATVHEDLPPLISRLALFLASHS